MCNTNMCIPRDSSKRFLNMEVYGRIQSQINIPELGYKLRFWKCFPRLKRSFGVGPHMENMHNLFKRPKQK